MDRKQGRGVSQNNIAVFVMAFKVERGLCD